MSENKNHISTFIFGIIFLILIFSFGLKEKENSKNGTLGNAITLPLIHTSDTQGIIIQASVIPEITAQCSNSNDWSYTIQIQNKCNPEIFTRYHQKFLFLSQILFIVFRQKTPPKTTGEEPPHIA